MKNTCDYLRSLNYWKSSQRHWAHRTVFLPRVLEENLFPRIFHLKGPHSPWLLALHHYSLCFCCHIFSDPLLPLLSFKYPYDYIGPIRWIIQKNRPTSKLLTGSDLQSPFRSCKGTGSHKITCRRNWDVDIFAEVKILRTALPTSHSSEMKEPP